MKKSALLLSSTIIVVTGCTTAETSKDHAKQKKVELTISAASSLQNALLNIKTNFENKYPNVKINFNFGASGALQQQISNGAPVDLFFSAAEDKFNILMKDGLLEKKNEKDLLGNELVLVVPKDVKNGINSFEDLSKATKISIGTPEVVPAGKYAMETLQNIKVWNSIEGKMVYAKDVRQVLTYVETGNVDAGIVYKTDALTSSKVKIIATANENCHDPIIYPVGVIKNSTHSKEARLFYEYLQKDRSMKIFQNYGFIDLH
ncbi:molybdate ABC transporter substrate-binding protein [Bacillus sp. RG28]|uniref:Molybdate ABC transporter substrate-binding protein n=1 Tax=Gottfriedia endophytica TaxID=2820819 RepID=A0A940NTB4_9BACI|nr:molybdate ABC transporter substrate-binding protein [Gottfriedia endophytica]MBP0726682.1 molybdate ABC transporter substrate-binding protein [Gottfriedia endophytica]